MTNTKDIIPLESSTKTDTGDADTLLYIVPFEEGGYAIISGDRGAPPYLGYCPKGDFRESDLPPGLNYLLEKYKSKISKIKKEKKLQDEDIKKRWEEIYDQNQLKSVTSNVAPMLDTEWGQQQAFNDSVPNNYPAGCTAIAMAQILRYWACRVNPTGELTWIYNGLASYANFGATSYSWSNMDDSIGDEHNAQLIYHTGVSCKTKYGSSGSTSTPGRARDGFVTYWGMDNDADVKWRIYHLNNWKDMLVDELHDGRPILYSAGGAEIGDDWVYGHSWVIDGVTVDHNYFWCNWGWYGDYNGWYELGGFDPIDDNYNQMESAIFNVYPEQPDGVATPQLSNQTFTYSSNGYNLTIPEAFGATSYEWITNSGTISGSGTSVTLHADFSATVQVRAYNARCNIYSPYKSATITINYGPVTGSDVLCTSGSSYAINNVPSGYNVSWNVTPSSSFQTSSGTGTSALLTPETWANGIGNITFSFNIGGTTYDYSKSFEMNPPLYSDVDLALYTSGGIPVSYMCPNTHYHIYLNNSSGCSLSNYTWALPSGWSVNYYYNNMVSVYTNSSPGGMVEVYANTCCGVNRKVIIDYFGSGYCSSAYSLVISPNPTTGEATVAIEEAAEDGEQIKSASTERIFDETAEWDMEVYDNLQNLKLKKDKLKGNSTKIQSSDWKEGVYMVRVKYKDEILTGKLVVKK